MIFFGVFGLSAFVSYISSNMLHGDLSLLEPKLSFLLIDAKRGICIVRPKQCENQFIFSHFERARKDIENAAKWEMGVYCDHNITGNWQQHVHVYMISFFYCRHRRRLVRLPPQHSRVSCATRSIHTFVH